MPFVLRNAAGLFFNKNRRGFNDDLASATTWRGKGAVKQIIKARQHMFARETPLEIVQVAVQEIGTVETVTFNAEAQRSKDLLTCAAATKRKFRRAE